MAVSQICNSKSLIKKYTTQSARVTNNYLLEISLGLRMDDDKFFTTKLTPETQIYIYYFEIYEKLSSVTNLFGQQLPNSTKIFRICLRQRLSGVRSPCSIPLQCIVIPAREFSFYWLISSQ